ncbi:Glycolipid 2-alpha-mannosyltransferase [Wickerhamomyces ciferrii]|uniref:Glycolipid 2-alpha-mannosyltransferase n=1 Tax=Wickerhamomyces ciferrii (strain ATCC 14091 / BCRC 22168 / CBS 111 / JCM 3599 / NBRC 0793 / NRRL Y-1031 F-60-10) TaxID=1206466 RepID=K0KZ59_WICCF|nr:Glycolipid 2-alpha-mannosyltransferase [Wickerhamomyces ciferrii]CCH46659.1 Glycolipid 2-alpha-mannosyltransferase [Wickerhamomyces ciferrii]
MARLNGKATRIAVFSLVIIGLIFFLSNTSGPTYVQSVNKTKSNDANVVDQSQKSSVNGLFPDGRENATFVSLARNEDLWELVSAIRSVEDRFNVKYKYDWVFLNNEPFNDEFKTVMKTLVSGEAKFGVIPKEHWSYPEWISQEKAAQTRHDMKNIIYGSSESYRHMCRYESGFFYRHPLMLNYKYYWRVEPSTLLHCDVNFDVFKFMRENNKDYAFTITIHEFVDTIKTLWQTTKDFIKENPEVIAKDNLEKFVSNDGMESYNLCHYWTNFEVANMDFWRGEAYSKYFEYLDKNGGFFYERWGDAPVHSIAASLFLPQDRVHYFKEIGYFHGPYHNCPIEDSVREENKCMCKPNDDFTWKDYSCTRLYHDVKGLQKPKGWEKHTG